MALTPEQVIKRSEAAKADKSQFDSEISDICKYVMPGRNGYDNPGKGDRGDDKLEDDTAVNALNEFAGLLQSSLVAPYTHWAQLAPGTDIEETQHDELKTQLTPINNSIMTAIHHSNFDSQVLEMFMDLAIGTGALLVTKGLDSKSPLHFEAVPLYQIFPELGAFGQIDTCFRMFEVVGRNIMQRWADAKLSPKMMDDIDKNPGGERDIIEAVVIEPATSKTVTKYRYYVVDVKEKHELLSIEMTTSPWIIPRWVTRSGETLGRGPAWSSFPTIKTLNEMAGFMKEHGYLSVNPVVNVNADASLANGETSLSMEPGAINYLSGVDGDPISVQHLNGDTRIGEEQIRLLQEKIDRAFYIDQMGGINDPIRSATEITIRNQKWLQKLGTQFGKLQTEFIQKLIERVYDIMKGFNLVPQELIIDGKSITIEVVGAIANAKKIEDAGKAIEFFSIIGQMAPNLLPAMITSDAIISIGAGMGVSPEHLGSSKALDDRLEEIAKAQQAMQEGAPIEQQ